MSKSKYQIAVVRGDGIGPEVCDSAVKVVVQAVGASRLDLVDLPAGAEHYRKTGNALPEETFKACAGADAILHGAAMNHVLKDVDGDDRATNLATYGDPSLPIDITLVEAVADFVKP